MARTLTPRELQLQLELERSGAAAPVLLDVRRRADLEADDTMIAGARWLDPEKVGDWRATLPTDRPIFLYCVRGGSVSNSVLDALLERGLSARYLEGGISAWKQHGGATNPRQP